MYLRDMIEISELLGGVTALSELPHSSIVMLARIAEARETTVEKVLDEYNYELKKWREKAEKDPKGETEKIPAMTDHDFLCEYAFVLGQAGISLSEVTLNTAYTITKISARENLWETLWKIPQNKEQRDSIKDSLAVDGKTKYDIEYIRKMIKSRS